MDPLTIRALAAVTGGVLRSQSEREQALQKMKQDALMKAIEMQTNAYQTAGAGQGQAYNNMMNAYRGLL